MATSEREQQADELRDQIEATLEAAPLLALGELIQDTPEGREELRDFCFFLLSDSPNEHRVRLLLAKCFYLDELTEFAVRELIELQRRTPGVRSLNKLIDSFGPFAEPFLLERSVVDERGSSDSSEEESVVAEVDIDAGFLDVMNDSDLDTK